MQDVQKPQKFLESSSESLSDFYLLLCEEIIPSEQAELLLFNSLTSSCYISEEINWDTMIQDAKKIQKSTCGKPIKEGELCFQCMDCAILKNNHLFCEECFSKVNHDNHRIKYKNTIWGYCDCGDEDAVIKSSFCLDHQSKIVNEKETRKRIPKEIRKKLTLLLNELFLKGLHSLEELSKEKIDENEKKTHILFICLLNCLSKMIDSSFSLLIFIAHLLIRPLEKIKGEDIKFFHECDIREEIVLANDKKLCKCSILGIIFKFNQFFSTSLRDQIVNFIFKLSPSTLIKEYVIFLMQKNVYQIVELRTIEEEDLNNKKYKVSISEFTKLHLFYIINKDMADKFIFSSDFIHIIRKIKKEYQIQECASHEQVSLSLRNTIQFFLWKFANLKKTIFFLFENQDILPELLKILLSVKPQEIFHDNMKEISFLQTNYALFLYIKKLFKIFNEDEDSERKNKIMIKLFENIIGDIFSCSLNEENNLIKLQKTKKLTEDIHFVNNVASKLFGLFMSYFIQAFDFNIKKTNDFLLNVLKTSNINPDDFISSLLTQIVLAFYSKSSLNNIKGHHEQSKNIINQNYSIHNICFEAYDRFAFKIIFLLDFGSFTIQKLLNIIEPDDIEKQSISSVGGFIFHLFNILIFDDISIINTLNSLKGFRISEISTKNQGYPLKNLEYLMANLHIIEPNFNYETIKKVVPKIKKREIDLLIDRISFFNKNTNLYELKEDFRNCFDLSLFPENMSFYSQLYERCKNISVKNNFSIILGNHPLSFHENVIFHKTIEKISKSNLIEMIFAVIIEEKDEQIYENQDVYRKTFKFLYFLLHYNYSPNEKKTIFSKLFNKELNIRKRIDDMLIIHSKNNSDYAVALQKIAEKIDEMMMSDKEKENQMSPLKIKESNNMMNSKKKAIMEEFQKKRMKFLETTTQEVSGNIVDNKKDDLVCSFCLQNQSKEIEIDILGVICYISQDNISSYLLNNKKIKGEGECKFYINSCQHLVHKVCHQTKFREKWFRLNKFFDSDIEFICNYCKTISNLIVPIVEPICNSIDLMKLNSNINEKNNDFNEFFLNDIKNLKINNEFVAFYDKTYKKFFEEFYNELIFANCYGEEMMDKPVVLILNEVLLGLFEKIYYKDLASFIANDLLLSRNLFYLNLYNFQTNEFMLLNELMEELSECSNKLLNTLDYNIKNDFRNLKDLARDLIKTLILMRTLMSSKENYLIKMIKLLIKFFISQIMIICFFIYNIDNTEFNFENLVNFFTNKEIISKTMTFMGPFYSIIIGFFISTFKTPTKYENFYENLIKKDIEFENSELFKEFEFILSPEPEILKHYIEQWKKFWVYKTNEEKTSLKEKFSLITDGVNTFSISKINNYDEFLVQFMSKKCEKCKFYPRNYSQKLFMCLICDTMLCIGKCGDLEEYDKKLGNLTIHSKLFHQGKNVFISLSDGSLLIIKFPLIISTKSCFMNKHGDLLIDNEMDFANYLMDRKKINKWVNSVKNKRLPQDVLNELSIDPECLLTQNNWSHI